MASIPLERLEITRFQQRFQRPQTIPLNSYTPTMIARYRPFLEENVMQRQILILRTLLAHAEDHFLDFYLFGHQGWNVGKKQMDKSVIMQTFIICLGYLAQPTLKNEAKKMG
jgi:hypothetical protein